MLGDMDAPSAPVRRRTGGRSELVRASVAKGVLSLLAEGRSDQDALGLATGMVERVVAASLGRDELDLIGSREGWLGAGPLAVETLMI